MLVTLFALAAVVGAEGPPCAILSRHQLLTGSSVDCCESCSLGWLRTTSWVTSSVKTSSLDTNSNTLKVESHGSGDLGLILSDRNSTVVAASDTKVLTRPCGECVSFDYCLDHGGHVNMWHRTCTRL